MAIYVVGYDLHPKAGEKYDDLINTIKNLGGWWHCLDSTWLVKSDLSATDVRDRLWKHMKADDQLLVVTYSRPSAWNGFSGDCQTWLSNNL
jgi:hypothetical protein